MLTRPVARFLAACVRADLSIVFAGAPGLGQDHPAVVLRGRARPGQAGGHRRGGLRGRRPAGQRRRACRPGRRGPTGPPSTCAGWSPGSCAWRPTWPSSGEVRDREALPLLLTLSSGVKGFTTIHAGSARQALTRLRFICQLSDTANELPMSALNSLVSEAIDLVVHCRRTPAGPAGGRDRGGRGPGRRARGHPVHGHRGVHPAGSGGSPAVDREPPGREPGGPSRTPGST